MSRYYKKFKNLDPRWTVARFGSVCSCGQQIKPGQQIFYYPVNKKAVCEVCGKAGQLDLDREKSMDRFGSDIFFDH